MMDPVLVSLILTCVGLPYPLIAGQAVGIPLIVIVGLPMQSLILILPFKLANFASKNNLTIEP